MAARRQRIHASGLHANRSTTAPATPSAATLRGSGAAVSCAGVTKIYPSGETKSARWMAWISDLFESELIVLSRFGSGKSTLLNILGGLDVPRRGTLTYRGEDLTDADENERTRFRRDLSAHFPVL